MLRPAVAATNWVRAGKTSGLNMGKRRLSVERKPDPGCAGTVRSYKLPGWRGAVNGAGDQLAAPRGVQPESCPGPAATTDKTSSFLRIPKAAFALYAG